MHFVHRLMDAVDAKLCAAGLRSTATWDMALRPNVVRLYAGKLGRHLPQYKTHVGITPYFPSARNIPHDVSRPLPIPDNSVDLYQSEDVFEHIALDRIVPIFNDVHRVLKPGGLFRLSVPDYNFDLYRQRSVMAANGSIIFDPDGGGKFVNGEVVGGGHVWFPTIDQLRALFAQSAFGSGGRVEYLQYNDADGTAHLGAIDYAKGHVQRSADHDPRVKDRPRPVSIVVDAYKNPE